MGARTKQSSYQTCGPTCNMLINFCGILIICMCQQLEKQSCLLPPFPGTLRPPPCWSSTKTSREANPQPSSLITDQCGASSLFSLFKHLPEGGLIQTGISHPIANVASVSCCFITHYPQLILSSKPWCTLFFLC